MWGDAQRIKSSLLRGCHPQVQKSINFFNWSGPKVTRDPQTSLMSAMRTEKKSIHPLHYDTHGHVRKNPPRSSKGVHGAGRRWARKVLRVVGGLTRWGEGQALRVVHRWVSSMALWSSMCPSKKQNTKRGIGAGLNWLNLFHIYVAVKKKSIELQYLNLFKFANFVWLQIISKMNCNAYYELHLFFFLWL